LSPCQRHYQYRRDVAAAGVAAAAAVAAAVAAGDARSLSWRQRRLW